MSLPSLGRQSRRSVVKGAAWTVPTIAVASAAPAMAVSGYTGTNDTAYFYFIEYNRTATSCSSTNYNSGGFIDTQACTPSGGPKGSTNGVANGDCLRNPSSSIGYWIETKNSTSGSAFVKSVTTTYTFSSPIAIDNCPNTAYSTGGTTTWTECTTLNGWTYTLSADGKTLTLTYNTRTTLQTSTSANGSGTSLPGYFLNYHFTSTCAAGSQTISSSTTMTWGDAAGTYTFTKNTGPAGV